MNKELIQDVNHCEKILNCDTFYLNGENKKFIINTLSSLIKETNKKWEQTDQATLVKLNNVFFSHYSKRVEPKKWVESMMLETLTSIEKEKGFYEMLYMILKEEFINKNRMFGSGPIIVITQLIDKMKETEKNNFLKCCIENDFRVFIGILQAFDKDFLFSFFNKNNFNFLQNNFEEYVNNKLKYKQVYELFTEPLYEGISVIIDFLHEHNNKIQVKKEHLYSWFLFYKFSEDFKYEKSLHLFSFEDIKQYLIKNKKLKIDQPFNYSGIVEFKSFIYEMTEENIILETEHFNPVLNDFSLIDQKFMLQCVNYNDQELIRLIEFLCCNNYIKKENYFLSIDYEYKDIILLNFRA